MHDSLRFRRHLAARILGALGTASLVGPAACGDGGYGGGGLGGGTTGVTNAVGATTGAGTTTVAGTTTGAGATTAGPPPVQQCFDWSPDMGDCPTYSKTILDQFTCCGCPTGWEPYEVDSPPTVNAEGQCCYLVRLELCAAGGRPYFVGGEARVAPVVRAAGANAWSEGARPDVAGLGADERAALAEAWTADALLEQASVASFSRFSLALLAAGAPGDLVELAHRAALDEIRHARLCFGLASAYAGEDIAPGRFPVGEGARAEATVLDIAVSTVREGCVAETVAAAVAAEQLARATDPAVRAALAEIAADEARHAELAWKTVAWAVEAGGKEVRAAVARTLFEALAGSRRAREAPRPTSPTSMERHGRLDTPSVASIAASAMAEIVAPAAWALFGGEGTPAAERP